MDTVLFIGVVYNPPLLIYRKYRTWWPDKNNPEHDEETSRTKALKLWEKKKRINVS